jgi:hypothetical protein
LKEVTINGKREIMANYFHKKNKPITKEEVEKEKEKDKKEKDEYEILKHVDKDRFNLKEYNSLAIVKGPAVAATTLKPEEKTSFMVLEVVTFDDTLSKVYSEVFLETLREYYLDSKTSKIKTAVERQQRIVDSLKYLTQANENSLARIQDQNQEAVFAEGKVQVTRLNRKSQMLTNSYQEQDRALQNFKFQLYQDSPLFRITSPQRYPISESKSSLTKSYKIGIYIGIFIGFIFIALLDAVRSIMNDEKK